ncbi:MAG: lmo0937 family membrane protein [Silvibacterium sp.]
MFLAIALLLLLAWIAGFVVFHVTAFFIHILLILAVIAIIVHFTRGRSVAT